MQASLRYVGCALWQQKAPVAVGAAATSRQFSSDAPPQNISRYPIPNKKDLPFDMLELMEEVETKVTSNVPAMKRHYCGELDNYIHGVISVCFAL